MVQFLIPKLFTIFVLFVNSFGLFIAQFYFPVLSVIQTIFLVVFCVTNKIEISYVLHTTVFIIIFSVYLTNYLCYIFYKYANLSGITEKLYNEIPYPRGYLDDLILKEKLLIIGYLTLAFVTNFANMWIYRINYYKSLNAVNISTQTLLSQNEEDE